MPQGAPSGPWRRPGHDGLVGGGQPRDVGPGRQVLHEDLADRLPLERHAPGDHLEQDDAQRVDVDRLVVLARGDLGGHVVARADALGVLGDLAGGDELGQAVVADLDDPLFHEDVGGLEVAVDDPVVVQVRDPLDDPPVPGADLGQRQAVRVPGQDVRQARAGDVFHDDEGLARVVGLQVVDGEQVRALQVHALHDPAPLDLQVAEDELQRHLLARVGRGVVDLAEPAPADGAFDGVPVQGARARAVGVAVSLGCGDVRGHLGGPHGPIRARLWVGLVSDRLVQVRAGDVSGRRAHHQCNSWSG